MRAHPPGRGLEDTVARGPGGVALRAEGLLAAPTPPHASKQARVAPVGGRAQAGRWDTRIPKHVARDGGTRYAFILCCCSFKGGPDSQTTPRFL